MWRWLCSVCCCRLRGSLKTWSFSREGSDGPWDGPRFSSPSSFTSTSSICHSASRSMSACGSSRDPLLCRCMGLSWGELAVTSRATTSGLTTRDKPKSAIFTEQSTHDTSMLAAAVSGDSRGGCLHEIRCGKNMSQNRVDGECITVCDTTYV